MGTFILLPDRWRVWLPDGVVMRGDAPVWVYEDRQGLAMCLEALATVYVVGAGGYRQYCHGNMKGTGSGKPDLVPGNRVEVTSRRDLWPRVTSMFCLLVRVVREAVPVGIAGSAVMRLRQRVGSDEELVLGLVAGLLSSRHVGAVSWKDVKVKLRLQGLDLVADVVADDGPLGWLLADLWSVVSSMDMKELYGGVGGYDRLAEDLVAECCPDDRGRRGVYVTPPELAGYVVRSVEKLLNRDFGGVAGLIVDPACGSGAFLRAAADHLDDHVIRGRELMLAPYVFAVMASDKSRVEIELGDAFTWEVADQGPMVVMGNPPYSGHSATGPGWIDDLVDDYRSGDLSGERNMKWLRDDYVKFFRLGQSWVERAGSGIVAMVTNHSYLDNPTFRGMRRCLMESFTSAFLLDLQGNLSRRLVDCEQRDENVFNVRQGVAVSMLVRSGTGSCQVFYHGIRGSRESKLGLVSGTDVTGIPWESMQPGPADYLFVPRCDDREREWRSMVSVCDIFPVHAVGIVTGNDQLLFDRDRERLRRRFTDLPEAEQKIVRCLYRPFDERWLMYDDGLVERSRRRIMQHMMGGGNVAILAKRQSRRQPFSHVWCTNVLAEGCVLESAYANNTVFPLYVKSDGEWDVNIDPGIRVRIEDLWGRECSPLEIMSYVYAMLHSPHYRQRYGIVLQGEFPRIPVSGQRELVEQLVEIGGQLLSLHLRGWRDGDVRYEGELDPIVEPGYPRYVDGAVVLNRGGCRFEPVEEDVWRFMIGGYRVCKRWLVDRGREGLGEHDVEQYCVLVSTVVRTRQLMEQIDQVIDGSGGWPFHHELMTVENSV